MCLSFLHDYIPDIKIGYKLFKIIDNRLFNIDKGIGEIIPIKLWINEKNYRYRDELKCSYIFGNNISYKYGFHSCQSLSSLQQVLEQIRTVRLRITDDIRIYKVEIKNIVAYGYQHHCGNVIVSKNIKVLEEMT